MDSSRRADGMVREPIHAAESQVRGLAGERECRVVAGSRQALPTVRLSVGATLDLQIGSEQRRSCTFMSRPKHRMSLTLDMEAAPSPPPAIERRFLDWGSPFLPAVAAALGETYSAGAELNLGGVVVVVPGARAGRRLKELLLAESEERGLRLLPPRVVTVGSLPELLIPAGAPIAGDALARRAWVMALRQLPDRSIGSLLSRAPAAGDVRRWTRFARTVETLHREVAGAGLSFGDVAARAAEDPLFDDSQRWLALAEAQAHYTSILDGVGVMDAGAARIRALETGVMDPGAELWLAGVVEMPRVLKQMLLALRPAAPIRTLVHAPASESGSFDALGCVLPAAWAGRGVPIPDDRLSVCERPADQAAEVARAVGALEGRYAADEITIAAPDDEVLPYLEQRLGTAGVPVRRATGGRVARAPSIRLLAAVAEYLDGYRYDACASLARHPDLWEWIRRAGAEQGGAGDGALASPGGWLTALDEHFSRRLPTRLRPGGVTGPGSSAAVVGALCRALGHPELLGRLHGRRRIGEWMPDVLHLLVGVYGASNLDRARPHERDLLESLMQAKGAAASLHRLPASLDEEVDAATAIRLLLDELADRTISPHGEDAAIELLGWLEVHLDDAPVTIVTGLNEGSLPESVNAHSYLPDRFRSRLGLLDNEARYARDAYQLTALLRSKEEVRLIAGRQTVRGDPLRPSRLMFAVPGDALARRVRRFYGSAPEGDTVPTSIDATVVPAPRHFEDAPTLEVTTRRDEVAAGDGPGFVLPPEPRLLAPEPVTSLSVSRFGAVLTDPYLFALHSLLGLEPLDDDASELDGLGFGNLAHQVLQRFGESELSGCTDPVAIRAELDRLLDLVAEERHGREAVPAVLLQAEQLRLRLHAFADWQSGWAAAGWRIAGVECRTPTDGVSMPVDGQPFTITGRIDRIDFNPRENAWAVFDYKTGDSGEGPDQTHRTGKGADRVWTDLQLPLYRLILPHVIDGAGNRPLPDGADDVRLGYIVLPRDSGGVGATFAEWTTEELDEAEEAARDVVRLLRAGEFVWDPDLRRRVNDPRMAALLGLGYLEAASSGDDAEGPDA